VLTTDIARIAELLQPFLAEGPGSRAAPALPESQLRAISTYIDVLLHWNQTINLTAVRRPEDIVTRHFGESFFAARHLFHPPDSLGKGHSGSALSGATNLDRAPLDPNPMRLVDVGSGAGFPGLPIKIQRPDVAVTLIEANHKKAVFLREVIRALTLTDIDVFPGRSETYPPASAVTVTLRAVERFESAVAAAARIVGTRGRLALLIGSSQAAQLPDLLPKFSWPAPIPIPLSSSRVLLIGTSELKP
jgi:16S rRNA (guanine527-N7)-methyltransferase